MNLLGLGLRSLLSFTTNYSLSFSKSFYTLSNPIHLKVQLVSHPSILVVIWSLETTREGRGEDQYWGCSSTMILEGGYNIPVN